MNIQESTEQTTALVFDNQTPKEILKELRRLKESLIKEKVEWQRVFGLTKLAPEDLKRYCEITFNLNTKKSLLPLAVWTIWLNPQYFNLISFVHNFNGIKNTCEQSGDWRLICEEYTSLETGADNFRHWKVKRNLLDDMYPIQVPA